MKAIKENKVYTVDELTKKEFLAQGYDIVDNEGKVIERSPSATVPYAEYERVCKECAELKEKLAKSVKK